MFMCLQRASAKATGSELESIKIEDVASLLWAAYRKTIWGLKMTFHKFLNSELVSSE
jgi:hypothetical protein